MTPITGCLCLSHQIRNSHLQFEVNPRTKVRRQPPLQIPLDWDDLTFDELPSAIQPLICNALPLSEFPHERPILPIVAICRPDFHLHVIYHSQDSAKGGPKSLLSETDSELRAIVDARRIRCD